MQALPASASIACGASLLWLFGGLGIGVASARNRSRWGDRIPEVLALAALSVPAFVIALAGLMFFYRVTGIYAGNRYVPLTQNPIGWLAAMWLPWICLAFPLIAVYARTVRSQLLTSARKTTSGPPTPRVWIRKGYCDTSFAAASPRSSPCSDSTSGSCLGAA